MGLFGASGGSRNPRPRGRVRARAGSGQAPELAKEITRALEVAAAAGATSGARRRDRRGRGLRGPLLPAVLPGHRTRAGEFDELLLDAVEDVERDWARQLSGTEFAVEDVPPSDPAPWEDGAVPLGRCFPAHSGQPARVVVYRRPLELRAQDDDDLADLVHAVVVEQVAHLLARTPEEIDPRFDEP